MNRTILKCLPIVFFAAPVLAAQPGSQSPDITIAEGFAQARSVQDCKAVGEAALTQLPSGGDFAYGGQLRIRHAVKACTQVVAARNEQSKLAAVSK